MTIVTAATKLKVDGKEIGNKNGQITNAGEEEIVTKISFFNMITRYQIFSMTLCSIVKHNENVYLIFVANLLL